MKTVAIECDFCERDLGTTGNCVDYRVVVSSEPIPNPHPTATLMHVEPAFPAPMHFCGRGCLLEWAKCQPELSGKDPS